MNRLNIKEYNLIDKSNTINNLILLQSKHNNNIYVCWVFDSEPTEQQIKDKESFNNYIVNELSTEQEAIQEVKTMTNFEWAKAVSIPWMDIVKENKDTLELHDNEGLENENWIMTYPEYISRQANYYNEECATGLKDIEEWITCEYELALHIRGHELGLVDHIEGEQELINKLKVKYNYV